MSNPERRPLPEGVHDSFTYLCADCGCTVTVVQSITQPHACKGTVEREIAADAWDKGRRAGQMDPRGLYPTPNPYRSQGMSEELTSAEQLDMLPTGSVIRDLYGDEWRKFDATNWEWLVDEDAYSRFSHEIPLPATLVK